MQLFIIVPLLAFANIGIKAASIRPDPIVRMKHMRQVHNADFSSNPGSNTSAGSGSGMSNSTPQSLVQRGRNHGMAGFQEGNTAQPSTLSGQSIQGPSMIIDVVSPLASGSVTQLGNSFNNPTVSNDCGADESSEAFIQRRAESALSANGSIVATPSGMPSLPVPANNTVAVNSRDVLVNSSHLATPVSVSSNAAPTGSDNLYLNENTGNRSVLLAAHQVPTASSLPISVTSIPISIPSLPISTPSPPASAPSLPVPAHSPPVSAAPSSPAPASS